MNLHNFIKTFFPNWEIAGVTTYGTEYGYLKLREGEVFIKVYFILRGAKHWTDEQAVVDCIVGCQGQDMYIDNAEK